MSTFINDYASNVIGGVSIRRAVTAVLDGAIVDLRYTDFGHHAILVTGALGDPDNTMDVVLEESDVSDFSDPADIDQVLAFDQVNLADQLQVKSFTRKKGYVRARVADIQGTTQSVNPVTVYIAGQPSRT